MNFRFEYLDSQLQPRTTLVTKPQNESEVRYRIAKFQMDGNRSYEIDVRAELAGYPLISTGLTVSIFVETSEMLAFIEGGNRQNGYEHELLLRAVVKDLDVEE